MATYNEWLASQGLSRPTNTASNAFTFDDLVNRQSGYSGPVDIFSGLKNPLFTNPIINASGYSGAAYTTEKYYEDLMNSVIGKYNQVWDSGTKYVYSTTDRILAPIESVSQAFDKAGDTSNTFMTVGTIALAGAAVILGYEYLKRQKS